jgi:TonB family protein
MLHLIIFLMISIYFNHSFNGFPRDQKQSQFISSYLSKNNFSPTNLTQSLSVPEKISTKKHLEHKNIHLSLNKATKQTTSQQEGKNAQEADTFLTLLHQAIQDKQRYPSSALQMQRQGRVTVGFVLSKEGTISNLRLIHSSGTKSLDEAALAAVREAVPFEQAHKYLRAPQEFMVGVLFELPPI